MDVTPADQMSTSARLAQAETDRDLARAELATANAEISSLRGEVQDAVRRNQMLLKQWKDTRAWEVAESYQHDCFRCGWSIQRGEAFEPAPDTTTKGTFRHVLCRVEDPNDF